MRVVKVKVNPLETSVTLVERGQKRIAPIRESPYYKALKQRSPVPILDYLDGHLGRDFSAQMMLLANAQWTLCLAELIKIQGLVPRSYEAWPHLRGRLVMDGHRRVAFCAAMGIEEIEVENDIQCLYPWWSQAFKVGDGWVDIAFPPDYEYQVSNRMLCYDTWDIISSHLRVDGKSVLDLGCGPGFYCHRAIDAGAASVTGIDRDEYILQTTNPGLMQNVIFQARDIAWLCGYGDEKILYSPIDLNQWHTKGKWDIVLALRVHYHLENPTKFLTSVSWNAREILVVQCNPTHQGPIDGSVEFAKSVLSPLWKEVEQVSGPQLPILICRGKWSDG